MMIQASPRLPRYQVDLEVDVLTPQEQLLSLSLDNVSLGGAFLVTRQPEPPGTTLSILLQPSEHGPAGALALSARVVHVVPDAGAARRVPGMGVEFLPLSFGGDKLLRTWIDDLASAAARAAAVRLEEARAAQAEAARAEAARAELASSSARFVDAVTAVVAMDRATLTALWEKGLAQGGLYVRGAPPPLGSRVRVVIGSLHLNADVVYVDEDKGAGLHLLDFEGAGRASVEQFITGAAERVITALTPVHGPPIGKVLAAARTLFLGLERNDPFAAVGMAETADTDAIHRRIKSLEKMFSAPRADISVPQRARLASALPALARVEVLLLERAAAARRHADLAIAARTKDQLKAVLAEVTLHEERAEPLEAQRLLRKALTLAPDAGTVRAIEARIDRHTQTLETARVSALLERAEVFVDGVGMREDAKRIAREAVKCSRAREVRLRALRVLAKAGEPEEAIAIAEMVIAEDPRDPLALQALLHLHDRAGRVGPALAAGRVLLRLRSSDEALRTRVERLEKLAKREET